MPDETTDLQTLASRLDAVERALTDDDRPPANAASESGPAVASESGPAVGDPSPTDGADLEASIAELDRRVSDLSAELDAVRGLLGGVNAVNEAVERRADVALATAERLAEAHEEADGLRVERLPDESTGEFDAADSFDGDDGDRDRAGAAESREGDDAADSLAARLRGAL